MIETHSQNLPFAAFSRVSNPAASGFSVEAFPGHTFSENGEDRPALMSFCTVQDNTSFGADFRIASRNGA